MLTILFACVFFLIIDFHVFKFLHAVIAQNFNPTAELVTPMGLLTIKAKAKIKTHSVTADAKLRKVFNIT